LGGYVYDQTGVAKAGLTVELWAVGGGAATASDTTDANGYYQFTSVAVGSWRKKIIDGTNIQWIDGRSEIQLDELDLITTLRADTIAEHTAAAGVTVDSCLIKDGKVDALRQSIWVQPHFAEGTGAVLSATYDVYAVSTLVDAQVNMVYFTIPIPSDFTTLTKAVMVIIAVGTGNLYRNVNTSFAATGEAFSTHSDAVVLAAVAVTSGQILDDDISAAFTGIAAGDRVGLQYYRAGDNVLDTVGASVYVLGLLLEYT